MARIRRTKSKLKVPEREIGLAKWQKEQALQQARIAFIVDEQMRSPEYWWEQACSQFMPLQRFVERARQERWASKREKFRAGIEQGLLKHHKWSKINELNAQLARLTQLTREAYEAIEPKVIDGRKYYPVAPGTMEGMIGAIVKLEQLSGNARSEFFTHIEPELVQEQMSERGSGFTPEEAREVASFLLDKRHATQRQLLEEHKEDEQKGVRTPTFPEEEE